MHYTKGNPLKIAIDVFFPFLFKMHVAQLNLHHHVRNLPEKLQKNNKRKKNPLPKQHFSGAMMFFLIVGEITSNHPVLNLSNFFIGNRPNDTPPQEIRPLTAIVP